MLYGGNQPTKKDTEYIRVPQRGHDLWSSTLLDRSLMEPWSFGFTVVQHIPLTAMRSIYRYRRWELIFWRRLRPWPRGFGSWRPCPGGGQKGWHSRPWTWCSTLGQRHQVFATRLKHWWLSLFKNRWTKKPDTSNTSSPDPLIRSKWN